MIGKMKPSKKTRGRAPAAGAAALAGIRAWACQASDVHAAAGGGGALGQTELVRGTFRLIGDVTGILLVLAPSIGLACILYFQIRKSAANENEQQRWHDRTVTAVVCIVMAVAASSLIKVIVNSYAGGNI